MTNTLRSSAIQVFQDQGGYRLTSVVGPVGLDVDAELVPCARGDCKERIGSKYQRPNVERSVCIVRRHILRISGNGEIDTTQKEFLRNGGYSDCGTRQGQAGCMVLGAKDVDLALRVTIG